MSPHACWIYLLVVGSLSVVFHFLPPSVWTIPVYIGVAGARSVATWWALRRHRPLDPVPWRLMVVATAAWTVGELCQIFAEIGGYVGSLNLSDAFFVLAYLAMGVGLVRLGRGADRHGPPNGLVDAAIVFVAAAVLAWAFLVTPTTLGDVAHGLPATLRMLYPVLDLGLIALLVWMGAAPEVRTPAYRVMVLALLLWAGSNAAYHLETFSSDDSPFVLQDTWLASHVLWGTAVLMPSLTGFWARRDRALGEYTTGRLAMLLVATMSAPLTLVLQVGFHLHLDVVAAAIGGAAMGLLSTVRLRRLIRRLSDQAGRLETLSCTDFLTGLPNRRALADHLQGLLDRSSAGVGVLVIDLDRFKGFNDAFGHRVGDELLIAVSRRWAARLGRDVFLARTGGDEFTAVVPTGGGADAAVQAAWTIVDSMVDPVVVSHLVLAVDASIGVSTSHGIATTAEALLHDADVAMYVAKARQSQVVLHCDDLDSGESDRVLILNDLRGGLSRGELTMHFQPQLDLTSGIVLGVEALVRWTHPVRGAIPPGEFIPAAEKTGLIRAITRFALRTALAACAEWRAAGRELRVAVNVSALNLVDASFVDDIVGALDEFGIPARLLDIEVTESNAMLDIGGAAQMLDQLAELGIRIVIDDFGTGHSSLEYLQRLPLDVIKIDQSFVKGMSVSSCDETIVRSTIGLARSLGMESVAEGTEDLAALDTLRSLGCNTAQGYAIARPMPQTDVLGAIEAIEQVHRRPAQPGAHAPGPNDEASSGSARTRSRGSSA